jgi:hypothetical protein
LIVGIFRLCYLRQNISSMRIRTKRCRFPLKEAQRFKTRGPRGRQGREVVTLNVQTFVFRQRLSARSTYCLPPENGPEHIRDPMARQPLNQGKMPSG